MGEQRPVLAVLTVFIRGRTDIGHTVECSESCDDIRTRSAGRTGQRGRTDNRSNARWASRRIETGQAAARDDPASCETAILAAELEVIARGQLFVCVEPADQPVQLAPKGFALQAEFLGEGVELAIDIVARRAIEDVDPAIVGVAALARTIFAIGSYRGQRRAAQIPLDLAREAIVLGLAFKAATVGDVDRPIVAGIEAGHRLAQIAQHVDDVVAAGLQRRKRGRRVVEIANVLVDAAIDIDRRAATLFAPGIVGDQADSNVA